MMWLEVFAGGLAVVAGKQFYGDALRPGAKELGKAGAAAVRAIRAAGIGPEQAVELRDDLITFVSRAVRRVPDANRIEPAPQILGPILEQLRYEPIDTPIADLLEEILARSMDKDRVFEAHPAFVQLARSLSADEVRILRYIAREPLTSAWRPSDAFKGMNEPLIFPDDLLDAPQAYSFYFDHMHSLDLVAYDFPGRNVLGGNPSSGGYTFSEYRCELILQPIGKALMHAADPSPAPAGDDEERAPSA